ncbi:hypothetical protein HPP92_014564 [Vanilla planifolia]|uniref:Uncharacterized protein n=1 Tax=Vanilla planifolia TaxID=51239 RepID=A0A835QRV8_VANPL|nr:hypothetical protein HPP92_014564 [Vanilla planifolia]
MVFTDEPTCSSNALPTMAGVSAFPATWTPPRWRPPPHSPKLSPTSSSPSSALASSASPMPSSVQAGPLEPQCS